MGWTIYHSSENVKPGEECTRLCTWTNDDGARRVLASAFVGSTWYAAVEHVKPDGERRVWAAVFLTKRKPFGYKDMDEGCGPYESDCPARVLDLLTPLPDPEGRDKYAAEWRARCRENASKPKLPPLSEGATVRMAHAYGDAGDVFTAHHVMRRGRRVWRFRALDGRGLYNLQGWSKHRVA